MRRLVLKAALEIALLFKREVVGVRLHTPHQGLYVRINLFHGFYIFVLSFGELMGEKMCGSMGAPSFARVQIDIANKVEPKLRSKKFLVWQQLSQRNALHLSTATVQFCRSVVHSGCSVQGEVAASADSFDTGAGQHRAPEYG